MRTADRSDLTKLKRLAGALKVSLNIPHHAALERAAELSGFDDYSAALRHLSAGSAEYASASYGVNHGVSHASAEYSPLTPAGCRYSGPQGGHRNLVCAGTFMEPSSVDCRRTD